MKSKLTSVCLVLILSFLFYSCATIVSHTSYPLSIRTSPKGANVSISNKRGQEIFKGNSPALVNLEAGAGYFSKASYLVKISANGYAEQIIPVNFKLNGWYFGNIILGGLIGMLIVDPLTGAMWKIEDPVVNTTLNPVVVFNNVPQLKIADIKDLPENLKSSLVRIK
jgi:hypothetical protein